MTFFDFILCSFTLAVELTASFLLTPLSLIVAVTLTKCQNIYQRGRWRQAGIENEQFDGRAKQAIPVHQIFCSYGNEPIVQRVVVDVEGIGVWILGNQAERADEVSID